MAQQNLGTQDTHTNMYDLAVLLAEGQSNVEALSWAAFIDNLSRITDAFADARATSHTHEADQLITV